MPLATFDWITLAVETAGIVIFCIWVVVPIREFRAIFSRVVKKQPARSTALGTEVNLADSAPDAGPEPLPPTKADT